MICPYCNSEMIVPSGKLNPDGEKLLFCMTCQSYLLESGDDVPEEVYSDEEEEVMDEERALYLAGLALSSDNTATLTLPMRSLWLIVSALQLTVSHPGLHEPLKSISEGIGRDLQQVMSEALPAEVIDLLELGWHREFDYVEEFYSEDDPGAPGGWYDED